MKREWAALLLAMVLPTLLAWVYFVALAKPATESGADSAKSAAANPAVQAVYACGKAVQFAFPLLWVWWAEGRLPRPARPTFRGLALGAAFGIVVAGCALLLYFGVLRATFLRQGIPAKIRIKAVEFGLATPAAFLLFGFFLSAVHSLLEEYYWRWFVFGRLRHRLALGAAILLSSAAFMAHHVIDLGMFLPGKFLVLVVPLSLCVGAGGMVWAWLYHRTNSVYAPWVSHVLIDAAIIAVGYDMVFSNV